MVREYVSPPPAIVREDLASLARGINAAHAASEKDARSSLEHARRCGEMLLRAKSDPQLGNRSWMGWVALNTNLDHRKATRYMQIAEGWEHLDLSDNLTATGALNQLRDRSERIAAEQPELPFWTSPVDDAEDAVAATIAKLSPEQQAEVIERTEARIERQAAARQALAPEEQRKKWLALGMARAQVALKYFRHQEAEIAREIREIEAALARIAARLEK